MATRRKTPNETSSVRVPYAAESVQRDPVRNGTQPSQPTEIPSIGQARQWISEDEWKITIQENPQVENLRRPSEVSIFRVPGFLKESGKGEAYIPKRVSLGPYHHRSPERPLMKIHKGRALKRMMTRYNKVRSSDPVDTEFSYRARQEISQLEEKIRKMYEEKIDCDAETLALMLSLDGCFILEILRTLGGEEFPGGIDFYEQIFEKNKIDFTGLDILNDILMLENQVPLIVLRKLLELELNSAGVESTLFQVLVKGPSSKFYPFIYDMREASWRNPGAHVDHILGLLHSLIVYGPERADQSHTPQVNERADQSHTPQVNERADQSLTPQVNDVRRIPEPADQSHTGIRRIPPAVELRNAGIKFKHCNGGIKQIKFESTTMFLPPIRVTDHTEVLFRNLMAFEVCKASEVNSVTCYVSLMDELIESEEDVAVLRRSGIVTNYLGRDEEVAELFNGLCKGVTVSRKDDFKELKQKVNKHYKSNFKVWSAEFMRKHLTSPWTFVALVGAIFALLLTAVQTFYTVISYYKPKQ